MPYAIEMYLDPRSAGSVQEIWASLKGAGVPVDEGVMPHVTLGIFNEISPDFAGRLTEFARRLSSFEYQMSSVGLFATERAVVFLAPVVTKKLLHIHAEFHRTFADHKDAAWQYYLPENWVPHCTLAMDMERTQLAAALEVVAQSALPLRGRFVRAGILEFKPNRQIFECPLGSEGA